MACFRPMEAWQREDGRIVFRETKDARRFLWLPCGKCVGCRAVRTRAWAIRCVHEAQMHEVNSFVTLTYEDGKCPLSLEYRDFQLFMYRLRQVHGPGVRFYMCGEYGELNTRPHFHACLFGVGWPDARRHGDQWSSPRLEKLWPHGFNTVGDVTPQSAGYVARYCMKKVTGEMAKFWYQRLDLSTGELVPVVPEFGRMSLKPGIGYSWFQKYWKDVYAARDGVLRPGGVVVPPPRYYDDLLYKTCPSLACDKEVERYFRSQRFVEDCTPQRLLVRENCAKAREAFRRRSL